MKNKKRRKTLLILLILVLGVSIGYAAIATTLKINGTSKVKKATWDVYWDNVQVTKGSVTGEEVTNPAHILDDDRTTVEYAVILSEPGDFYEFTVDAVNNGTIDAMIGVKVNENTEIPDYVRYSATYLDGGEIENKHLLAKKTGDEPTKETYKVRVEYREDIDPSQLPTDDEQELSFDFSVEYVQADDTATESHPKICKRADVETLHTEQCITHGDGNGCDKLYSVNETITYGNKSTTNGELNSGDAFDCDVDGNGVYDSKTERFYYVSDYYDTTTKSFNSDYATLIYYNSVKAGGPDNKATFDYDSSNENWHGPRTGYIELPSTSQWSKVTLLNNSRQLLNEKAETTTKGGTLGTFDYIDKAARFLTVQEINQACGITTGSQKTGELDACEYLLENTYYSNEDLLSYWWLESANSFISNCIWLVGGYSRAVGSYFANNDSKVRGVRPAIDVAKTDILY